MFKLEMIIPVQDQPQNQSPQGTEPKLPSSPGLKIYFILGGLAVVAAIAIGVTLAFMIPSQEPPTVPTVPTETPKITISSEPPKENLGSVNAKIEQIDGNEKTILASTTTPGWDKQWKLFIDEKTTLATFESWSKASVAEDEAIRQGLDFQKQRESFEKTLNKLSISEFEVGNHIYVISGDDLAKTTDVKKVRAVLLQKS